MKAKIKPEFLGKILRGEKHLEIRQVEGIELVCSRRGGGTCRGCELLQCSYTFSVVYVDRLDTDVGLAVFRALDLPISRGLDGSVSPFIVIGLGPYSREGVK